MVKASCTPESSALVKDGRGAVLLSRAPAGCRMTVIGITGAVRAELEREGVLPGSTLVVATRTPLGGPVVVELGRTRLALSADVARQVVASPAGDPGGPR